MPDTNESYLRLITSEHYTKPKYKQYVQKFLDMQSPVVDIFDSFKTIFNIDTAVGDQLDIIGNIVGIGRKLPVHNQYIDPVLDDNHYRKVIKAKMLKNHWDGTIQGLQNIITSVFPTLPYEIVDAQDMSYTITIIDPNVEQQDFALLQLGYILPKPEGVKVNYVVLDTALFGWDLSNSFVDGWDNATWAGQ